MTASDGTDQPKPVVESSPEIPDLTTRALQQRIRQQEILAELGVVALQGRPFLGLLDETVRLTAEGMNAEFCKVLEYIPTDNRLRMNLSQTLQSMPFQKGLPPAVLV
jgi:hypothetical protein